MTDYSVAITLKDNGLLKKLEDLSKNGVMAKMSSAGSSSNNVWNKMESLGLNQLAKLTGIGLGVGSLVHLITKSSGILQGTFKLMEQSMMLIFKPIGDFIGLALRPVTLMLLTSFIIPFYKSVYPLFRDYGMKIGEFFAANPAVLLASVLAGILALKAVIGALKFPNIGGKGDCPDCNKSNPGMGGGGCIELCKTPTSGIPNPTNIPLPIPIPIPTGDPTKSIWEQWNHPKPEPKNTGGLQEPSGLSSPVSSGTPWWIGGSGSWLNRKKQQPSVMEQLGEAAATSTTSAEQDWSLVSDNSANIAATAFNIAMAWKKAEDTLKGAVSTLESWANNLSSKGPGMGDFKIPIRPRSITASWSQGIADTLP